MATADPKILNDFVTESKKLVEECQAILERIDGKPKQALFLSNYSNRIDRIMGAALSLAPPDKSSALKIIGNCAGLCKALSARGPELAHHQEFFGLLVSFLMDATDVVGDFLDRIDDPPEKLQEGVQDSLLERLKWIMDLSQKLPEFADKKTENLAQKEIDDLIKKLGL